MARTEEEKRAAARERDRLWRERHPERAAELSRARCRRWYSLNRARIRDARNAARRSAYARDKTTVEVRNRLWREANRDRARESFRRYYEAHPDVWLVYRQRRRARKVAAGGSFTLAEWKALVRHHDGCCAYCGERPSSLVVEHRVPLIRGGTNAITNILPSCASCNLRKGTLTEREYRARRAA